MYDESLVMQATGCGCTGLGVPPLPLLSTSHLLLHHHPSLATAAAPTTAWAATWRPSPTTTTRHHPSPPPPLPLPTPSLTSPTLVECSPAALPSSSPLRGAPGPPRTDSQPSATPPLPRAAGAPPGLPRSSASRSRARACAVGWEPLRARTCASDTLASSTSLRPTATHASVLRVYNSKILSHSI